VTPSSNRATAQPSSGLALEQYANAKRLPLEHLGGCGLSEVSFEGRAAVRVPSLNAGGKLLAARRV
jgi:hypothetical protein